MTRIRTTLLAGAASAALLLTGCSGPADPTAPPAPTRSANHDPAKSPGAGAVPNQKADATLTVDRDGSCRFDPDTNTVVQDTTVTGTVTVPVVATVWMTVTGPDDTPITDTATGHPLPPGPTDTAITITAPVSADVFTKNTRCDLTLTWTPQITG